MAFKEARCRLGRALAGALLLATLGSAAAPGAVAAAGAGNAVTSTGPCGSVTLRLDPGPAPGVAAAALRATSRWGPMVAVSWRMHWTTAPSGSSGSVNGSQLLLSDVFTWAAAVTTGRGRVSLTLDHLDLILWWGGRCTAIGTTVSAWIP